MSLSNLFKEIESLRKEIEEVKKEYYTSIKPLLQELVGELKKLNNNIERLLQYER
jgi:hypothetical protein